MCFQWSAWQRPTFLLLCLGTCPKPSVSCLSHGKFLTLSTSSFSFLMCKLGIESALLWLGSSHSRFAPWCEGAEASHDHTLQSKLCLWQVKVVSQQSLQFLTTCKSYPGKSGVLGRPGMLQLSFGLLIAVAISRNFSSAAPHPTLRVE